MCCVLQASDESQLPQMEQQLYVAVSSTSYWLDGVENIVLSGPVLLPENAETYLQEQEVQLALCAHLKSLKFCLTNSKPLRRH